MVTLTMATEKDHQFVAFIRNETGNGKVNWEPTAKANEFTASFRGKYNVTINQEEGNYQLTYALELKDENDRVMLRLESWEVETLRLLYQEAQRKSLNVDAAIDDIMGGAQADIKDEDIPF